MGFTGILLLFILALFAITVRLVVSGVRAKNWWKVFLSIALFLLVVYAIHFVFIRFITSM